MIIHHDQVWFIPGMEGLSNIQISTGTNHYINKEGKKRKEKKRKHLNRCRKKSPMTECDTCS